MNWFKIVSDYYKADYYTIDQVKVFVAKGKITSSQFYTIIGEIYVA